MDAERLFHDHRADIERAIGEMARRRHLSAAEQADFAGFVLARFVQNDYEILRRFKHRSSLWTFVVAAIGRLALDFTSAQWHGWQPSETAQRLGPAAILLERLVLCDRHTPNEAIDIARRKHGVTLSEDELHTMWMAIQRKRQH